MQVSFKFDRKTREKREVSQNLLARITDPDHIIPHTFLILSLVSRREIFCGFSLALGSNGNGNSPVGKHRY